MISHPIKVLLPSFSAGAHQTLIGLSLAARFRRKSESGSRHFVGLDAFKIIQQVSELFDCGRLIATTLRATVV